MRDLGRIVRLAVVGAEEGPAPGVASVSVAAVEKVGVEEERIAGRQCHVHSLQHLAQLSHLRERGRKPARVPTVATNNKHHPNA